MARLDSLREKQHLDQITYSTIVCDEARTENKKNYGSNATELVSRVVLKGGHHQVPCECLRNVLGVP